MIEKRPRVLAPDIVHRRAWKNIFLPAPVWGEGRARGRALLLLMMISVPASGAPPPAPQQAAAPKSQMPQQAQIINLNLMQALIAVKADDLAGVFGFIPEASAAPAFADYLLRNYPAMKRFVRKSEQDLKEVGAVNEWDQQAFLYLITLNNMGVALGARPIPEKWMNRVSTLSLAPAVSLAEITGRRKGKG